MTLRSEITFLEKVIVHMGLVNTLSDEVFPKSPDFLGLDRSIFFQNLTLHTMQFFIGPENDQKFLIPTMLPIWSL